MAINWAEIMRKTQSPNDTKEACREDDIYKELSEDPTKEEEEFLTQFTILLHIDLSQIRPNSSLFDVISEQILVDKRENIKKFIRYVTSNQKNCLFILDAWDEYSPSFCQQVTNIANGQEFPDATVLVTSRIRESTVLPKVIDGQCLINGFNKDQAQIFIHKILRMSKFNSSGDPLVKFVTDHHLWGVFSVPLMLTYLCLLQITGSSLKEKVTDLFHSIIKLSLGRHRLKNMKVAAADVKVNLIEFENEILSLGKLAYTGLANANTRTVFSKEEVIQSGGEAILDMGILQKSRSQDPLSPSCQFTFGHKSIQEFMAAIYISNSESAFNHFCKYLDSLIKVYDSQLFVTFVCGINPSYGQQLIERIQYISNTDTATAAQCPEFSSYGWNTDKPGLYDLAYRHLAPASDVTPFLVQCGWEMRQVEESPHDHREGFPFKVESLNSAIKLKPHLNMKMINVLHLSDLLQTSMVLFSEANQVKLYNMSHSSQNDEHVTTILDHVSKKLSNLGTLQLVNIKSDSKCKPLPGLFKSSFRRVFISNVRLHPSDLSEMLQYMSKQEALVVLRLDSVILTGNEASLCEVFPCLVSLRKLHLVCLSLIGYQDRLCEAIANLHKLNHLSMERTDMAAAGEAIITCMGSLKELTHFDMGDTRLSENQIRGVLPLLPSSLVFLSLVGLPLSAAMELRQVLHRQKQLLWLNVSNTGIGTQQLVELFSSVPPSIQVVEANYNNTKEGIVSITQMLPSLPNLQFVYIILPHVRANIIQELKEAFKQRGAAFFSCHSDYTPGLAKINNTIWNM